MKVLHVEAGKNYYGGPRQVSYLIEGLAKRGVSNVLACPIGAGIAKEIHPSTQVHEMAMRGDPDVGMALSLFNLIRAAQPDVVHLHSRRGADLWGGVAANLAAVPCVLSRRVDNPEPRWLVARKYRLFDHVITISEGIRQVLLSEGLAPHKMSCVRDAVDPGPFMIPSDRQALLREFNLPDASFVIGMVAQMIPRKGHRYLIEAVNILKKEYPALRVLLFGQGPLRAELEDTVSRSGLNDVIRFTGFRTDLPQWLGALDLLAHPADMEGLGVSLLQASAAAVPIIASRAGGLPEAVADGVSGLLFPPSDVSALCAGMRRLIDDEALRHQMGQAGRKRVLEEFSVDSMVEDHLAIYRKLIKRG